MSENYKKKYLKYKQKYLNLKNTIGGLPIEHDKKLKALQYEENKLKSLQDEEKALTKEISEYRKGLLAAEEVITHYSKVSGKNRRNVLPN